MGLEVYEQYAHQVGFGRQGIAKLFHNKRIADFGQFVNKSGGKVLSVGCGQGELEKKILSQHFDEVYGLDLRQENVQLLRDSSVQGIQAAVPPIPFEDDSFDTIVTVGTMEHLANERGFLEDARRCLKPGGELFLTLPIEVSIGGLIRHIGRTLVTPKSPYISENGKRFDYSREELLAQTPRDKHGTGHKYYNYKYPIRDLHELYHEVDVQGWPVAAWPFNSLKTANLILFVRATSPQNPDKTT